MNCQVRGQLYFKTILSDLVHVDFLVEVDSGDPRSVCEQELSQTNNRNGRKISGVRGKDAVGVTASTFSPHKLMMNEFMTTRPQPFTYGRHSTY